MTVAALVLEHGGNDDQAIAGLLHDAPEEAGTSCGGLLTLTGKRCSARSVDSVSQTLGGVTP